jgi:hypothetical protein
MEQDPPRGNRTVVKFISAKIKQHPNSHRWKDYNGRKVWTVNAKDVEYITVELIDNPEEINRIKREIEATKHDNTIDKKRKQQKIKELNQRLTSKTKQRQFQVNQKKDSLNKPESPPRIHHQEQIHIPDASLPSERMHSKNRT